MANTSEYILADHCPTIEIVGWHPNESGFLVQKSIFKKGIPIYNGVITEDDLSEPIVEFLLSKMHEGKPMYQEYLIKKSKKFDNKNNEK